MGHAMKSRLVVRATMILTLFGALSAHAQTPQQSVEMACESDIARLCSNVPPGGGAIKQCLMAQKEHVSFKCKRAVFRAKQAEEAAAPH